MARHKTSKIIAAIMTTVVVIAAVVVAYILVQPKETTEEKQLQSDSAKFAEEYPLTSDDNRFVYASSEEVLRIFKEGSGVVFLGFPECPWCQQLAPLVNQAAQAEGVEKIYYLNIRESRQNDDSTYQTLVAELEEYLEKDEQGNSRIYVPDVSFVKDGAIVGRFEQEESDEEDMTPEQYWTVERKERGIEQLRSLMQKIDFSN